MKYTVHVHDESGSAWVNDHWEGEGDGLVYPVLMDVDLTEANAKLDEYAAKGYTVHRMQLKRLPAQPLQRKTPEEQKPPKEDFYSFGAVCPKCNNKSLQEGTKYIRCGYIKCNYWRNKK